MQLSVASVCAAWFKAGETMDFGFKKGFLVFQSAIGRLPGLSRAARDMDALRDGCIKLQTAIKVPGLADIIC